MQQEQRPLNEAEVCAALGNISADTLKRLIDTGMFPDALQVSERTRYWTWKDIKAYRYLRGRCGARFPKIEREKGQKPEPGE